MDEMTKALIAIASWKGGIIRGENQALRDTWLQDVSKYPNLDYKFFVGDGTPIDEDETDLLLSFTESRSSYFDKAILSLEQLPSSIILQDDEMTLPIPDDYLHLAYKVREEFRWAIEHEYDNIFSIGADIYVDVNRLMKSGFEHHDYTGKLANVNPNCAGGGGYWVSRRAAERIVNKPVTFWAEDKWVGRTLHVEDTHLFIDSRYATDYPDLMHKTNNIISCHIGCHDGVFCRYNPEMMRAVHKKYLEE